MAGTNVSKEKIIEIMNSNGNELHQQLYEEDDGTRYFGAYKKLSFGNLAVVTNIERDTALKSVNSLTWQNIYLTLAVIFISILFVALYSKTISKPIQALTAVAQEINQGNFNTELFEELKSKRTDEIGVLIQSTKDEREILNTVSRLTNKGVAKAIVRKEIDFEPHLKDITIFFSDIRGFTAISDGFNKRFGEKSAAEIISFLNDYMSRMVNCITISGGNVDKFEGDAIMACWGVLRDENLDTPEHKKHVQEDAINAVRGVLAMRYALMVYNKAAEAFTKEHEGEPLAKYKPHIRIGSGLNSGRATVGFMGSYDKMEFTSIGDAVNLASRTESSNKPCGTDMLITEDTYNLLKYDYIKSPENNYTIKPENLDKEIIVEVIPVTFEVKGKGKQHFYGVVNMPRFDIEGFFKTTDPDFVADPDCICAIGPKGPRTLAEVRTLLGIPTPDFSGVNLDAEESKVKAN
jgi:adenylate cyclase